MNNSDFKLTNNAEGPDKVDMSLDDIIRLNKQQKWIQSQRAALKKQRLGRRGVLAQGRRAGVLLHRPGGPNKMFKRRGQGVVTGLAARKAALLKGVSPLNRPMPNRTNLNKRSTNRAPVKHPAVTQRVRPFVQRRHTLGQAQGRPYTQSTEFKRAPGRVPNEPFSLRRKWNAPPVKESRREARQATFLSRRGLKVRADVQKSMPAPAQQRTQRVQRTRPWRTPLNSSGILTVLIENPDARSQPEPAHSWSLHPAAVSPPTAQTPPEPERKKPKGVALQFDINSVGNQWGIGRVQMKEQKGLEQTAMTLNERFRILKQKRVTAVQQNATGGRFVTVG